MLGYFVPVLYQRTLPPFRKYMYAKAVAGYKDLMTLKTSAGLV